MVKRNLEADFAKTATPEEEDDDKIVTEEMLLEFCPKEVLARFKKAKNIGARADLYYIVYNEDLKKLKAPVKAYEEFLKKLDRWFLQNIPEGQTEVAGSVGRVGKKMKVIPRCVDWEKFYGYIKKKSAFELLNKAINAKAVGEYWDADKEVPGLDKFEVTSTSLTKVASKGK